MNFKQASNVGLSVDTLQSALGDHSETKTVALAVRFTFVLLVRATAVMADRRAKQNEKCTARARTPHLMNHPAQLPPAAARVQSRTKPLSSSKVSKTLIPIRYLACVHRKETSETVHSCPSLSVTYSKSA